jgi:hypothetical protein
MWWRWRRQQRQLQVRPEGERIPDGDTVCKPGQRRWAELLTRELPTVPPATASTNLVRGYVGRLDDEYHGRHFGEGAS